MSARQWFYSILLAYHVVAVTVDAIPGPTELPAVRAAAVLPTSDAISARMTPIFNRLAMIVARVEPTLFAALQPIRPDGCRSS